MLLITTASQILYQRKMIAMGIFLSEVLRLQKSERNDMVKTQSKKNITPIIIKKQTANYTHNNRKKDLIKL